MPKNTVEEIINAVERYKKGQTSQKAEAKKHGVSQQTFQDWIRKYESFGAEGFGNTGKKEYSLELKETAVKAYLNGQAEYAAEYVQSWQMHRQRSHRRFLGHLEVRDVLSRPL